MKNVFNVHQDVHQNFNQDYCGRPYVNVICYWELRLLQAITVHTFTYRKRKADLYEAKLTFKTF